MQCDRCHGTGNIMIGICGDPSMPYPCHRCGGSGIIHCCEGEVANDQQRALEDICIGSCGIIPTEHGLWIPVWIGDNQ